MTVHGILVLDLDGTVLVGDDPVLAYADAAAALLDARSPGRGAELRATVDAYLAGEPAVDAPDGYTATAAAARALGLGGPELAAAYASVAGRLEHYDIAAPPELAPLLAGLPPGIRVVVASNAPLEWVARVLERVELADLVDERHGDLGKPDGLRTLAARLTAEHELPAARLFGVGDIWRNDLEPIAALGGETALIDRWGRSGGDPDHRAATFAGIVPAIRAWATASAA